MRISRNVGRNIADNQANADDGDNDKNLDDDDGEKSKKGDDELILVEGDVKMKGNDVVLDFGGREDDEENDREREREREHNREGKHKHMHDGDDNHDDNSSNSDVSRSSSSSSMSSCPSSHQSSSASSLEKSLSVTLNLSNPNPIPEPLGSEMDNLSTCSLVVDANALATSAASSNSPPEASMSQLHSLTKELNASPPNISTLVLTKSDSACKPIFPTTFSPPLNVQFRISAIPIAVKSKDEVSKMEGSELEGYFGGIYKAIYRASSTERRHLYHYIYSLASLVPVANLIANSTFMSAILKDIKNCKSEAAIGMVGVLGKVCRHASYLHKDEEVLACLMSVLKGRKGVVRKVAAAAMGEVLFYAETQGKEEGWNLQGDIWGVVEKFIKKEEDEKIKVVGGRIIENCMCVGDGSRWASVSFLKVVEDFLRMEEGVGTLEKVVTALLTGKGAAGLKEISFALDKCGIEYSDWAKGGKMLWRVIEGGSEGVEGWRELLTRGLDGGTKAQQGWLNVINLILWEGPRGQDRSEEVPGAFKAIRKGLLFSKGGEGSKENEKGGINAVGGKRSGLKKGGVIQSLIRIAERGQSNALRAKAIVAIVGLCKLDSASLSVACSRRLLPFLERISAKKELSKSEYLWNAVSAAVAWFCDLPRDVVDKFRKDVGSVKESAVGSMGKKKGIEALLSKTAERMQGAVQIVGSRLMKQKGCVNGAFLRNLGWALLMFGGEKGGADLVRVLLSVLEVIIEDEDILYGHIEE